MPIDPNAVTAIIRDVVDAEVLPRFRNLSAADIREKTSPTDLVTEADIQAERVLTRRLAELLPGSVVVGEEACHADPDVVDRIGGEAPVWIIDPVDGTGNFSRGDAQFACIVALSIGGRTVMGWIDDCVKRETTQGVLGGGVTRSGRPITLADRPAKPLIDLSGHVGGQALMKVVRPRVARVVRASSAAHAYLALIDGRTDFSIFTRLKPWDHAAGILLFREAGGTARMLSGIDYTPTLSVGTPLMTGHEEEWRALSSVVAEFKPELVDPQDA